MEQALNSWNFTPIADRQSPEDVVDRYTIGEFDFGPAFADCNQRTGTGPPDPTNFQGTQSNPDVITAFYLDRSEIHDFRGVSAAVFFITIVLTCTLGSI
jgi:hypothetical protein